MKFAISGLGVVLIIFVVNGALVCMRKSEKPEKGKVNPPKLYMIIGAVCSVLFMIPALITAFSDESMWVSIVFSAFSLLGLSLLIIFINCRISYDEDGFVTKNFFGVKRKFTYDQITAIRYTMHENYIYLGNRKVMVDNFSSGGVFFIRQIRKKYRALHNGESIPRKEAKYDIFNGNVRDVEGILFAYILLSVVAIGFLIFSVCFTYFMPSTADNTTSKSVCFMTFDKIEDDIVMLSSDDEIYKIRFVDEQLDTEAIHKICDGEAALDVYCIKVTPDKEKEYYLIKAISYKESFVLDFEETNRLQRQANKPLILLAVIIFVILEGYVVASIVVGRNPRKYDKKIVKLFFKEGIIKY